MKKHRIVSILSAALALTLLFSLSGCGKKKAANAKTSASDTTSVTPEPPVIGGPDASLMGPLYYSDPEEADSAGLTSPVIRPNVEETPANADAQGAETSDAQGAENTDAAQSPDGAETSDAQSAESADAAQTSTSAGTSDAFAASDAYKQGYAAGEAAGYAQGYKAGYDEGGGVGYDNGYKAGRTAGYAEIAGIVTSRIADNTD